MTEAEADHWAAIMREVWIDQNAEMTRLIAIGWWPARRCETMTETNRGEAKADAKR